LVQLRPSGDPDGMERSQPRKRQSVEEKTTSLLEVKNMSGTISTFPGENGG